MPDSTKRFRQRITVLRFTESRREIAESASPRGAEHDPTTQRHLLPSAVRSNPFLNSLPICCGNHEENRHDPG
jgi:hypothetical protein